MMECAPVVSGSASQKIETASTNFGSAPTADGPLPSTSTAPITEADVKYLIPTPRQFLSHSEDGKRLLFRQVSFPRGVGHLALNGHSTTICGRRNGVVADVTVTFRDHQWDALCKKCKATAEAMITQL